MRKILGLICLFTLLTAFTCENEPLEGEFVVEAPTIPTNPSDQNCQDATLAVAEAALEFLGAEDSDYSSICNSYRNALQAQISACGDPQGTLQAVVDGLGDCTLDTSDPCEDANTALTSAQQAFNDATDENYTDLCSAYIDALELAISECGDGDGSLQQIIDDLGDCEPPSDNSAMGTIEVTAGTATYVFDEVTYEIDGTTIKITGQTSTTDDYMVYFEVEEDETGNDIINGTFVISFLSDFFPVEVGFGNFVSNIFTNSGGLLQGTFSGLVRNADNADLNLTSGSIDLEF